MAPAEKAKELIEKFIEPIKYFNEITGWGYDLTAAKQCARICVEEILKENGDNMWHYQHRFWQSVLTEIEKY